MRMSLSPIKLARTFALASLLILASCANLTNILGQNRPEVDVNAVACRAFHPITVTQAELATLTETTLLEIREHNAAYDRLCGRSILNP